MPATAQPTDYQRLFREMPDAFLLLSPEGIIIDNADRHVQTSLLPREQAVGRTIFDAYPSAPESQREIAESHEYVRQHLEPHTMRLLRYDLERPAEQGGGTEQRYWQITHYPLFDAEGKLEYILQRPQDVTIQTIAAQQAAAAAQALAETQERSRFILNSLPVMVWTNTPDGQPDFFNPRWQSFTGLTEAELIVSNWSQLAHPDDLAGLLAAWAESLRTSQPVQYEYRLRRHDGQYRWILMRADPQKAPDGHITLWVGSAVDIHEQRQMVAELLQTNEDQAALAEQAYQTYQQAEGQRQTYQQLFEQVPAIIAILRGPTHQYEFANPAYQALFPQRRFQGRTVAEAFPEVEQQGIITLLDQVYATGETFRAPSLEIQLARENGEMYSIYVSLVLQRFSEQNEPAGIIVFASEVTELVRAREELARLRENEK